MNPRLIAPSKTSGHNPITVLGRTYDVNEGSVVEVPQQDVGVLEANGWVPAGPLTDVAGPKPLEVTASRPLTVDDWGRVLFNASADAFVLTLPVTLPAEFNCAIVQRGAGKVTVAAGEGVTLNNVDSQFATSAQYAVIGVVAVGPNAFVVTGSTGA